MGIYIKGMKMPKDDEKIRFVKLLNGKMYAVKETRNGFPMSYLHEVIEVTEPHGRLIEVTNKLRQELCWYEAYTGIDEAPVEYATSVIDDAPTVIEAEGE